MSLVVTTYIPEGIIMASDSRQSLTVAGKNAEGKDFNLETINSDSVTKTFLLEKQKIGISNFGQDLLGGVPMASHIKRFKEEIVGDSDDVEVIASKIGDFFRKEFPDADTGFQIGGYKKDSKVSVPYVFYVHVSRKVLERRNEKPDKNIAYGATWSGQVDVLTGIMQPSLLPGPDGKIQQINKAPIIWDAMALQDAIDFSVYAIRTTIDTIRFQARPKNVGGSIDILAITPDGANWIQKKELYGESR
ncbi:MAG: hypothetical protein Q8P73_02070 [bacterium]|nr:hypothetical protein [bacterium]